MNVTLDHAEHERRTHFLIGRLHEVALKGANRWRFVDAVKTNLRNAFAEHPLRRIRSLGPRLIADLPDELDAAWARERAGLVFGLQNFSLSRRVEAAIEAITAAALELAREAAAARSFRVSARRADKSFPLDSMELERTVGAAIVEQLALRVDLSRPELDVAIEILPDGAYLSAGKLEGAGGLPVGITGRGLMLLSGGIDSPVAAYRMMGRGLHLDFLHFHSYPLVSGASRDKARELAALLNRYQARSTLTLAPFADAQRAIVARAPRPLRVILYRRLMLRIANALARQTGAQALVTGESLGQVASQTLENITVISEVSALPILRPLIGADKNEIVAASRRLGAFETSIQPDQDCCSLFVPDHPETRARSHIVSAAEAMFDFNAMAEDVLRRCETVELVFPNRC